MGQRILHNNETIEKGNTGEVKNFNWDLIDSAEEEDTEEEESTSETEEE